MRIPPAPATPSEPVTEEHFGERVSDRYRWLEDGTSARVRSWTDEQNERTRAVLDALPERRPIAARLRELLGVALLGTPRPVAGRIFQQRRERGQPQPVLHVRDGLDRADRALIDPGAIDPTGLTTLDWYYPSPDARLVAYGLSSGGTELSTLHVMDVEGARDLGLRIPHTQRAHVAWSGEDFYYTVHPRPGSVAPGDEHYHRRVRYHRLSDGGAEADQVVFGQGRAKEDILAVQASPCGRWILFSAFEGWVRSELYLLDRDAPGRGPVTVIEGVDGLTTAQLGRDALWLRTNLESPNYRIVRAPYERPTEWRTTVPESEDPIEEFALTAGHLVVHRLRRASSRLEVWRTSGGLDGVVQLPAALAVEATIPGAGVIGDPDSDHACFVSQSFTSPGRAVLVETRTGREHTLYAAPAVTGDELVTDQTSYRSADGTEVLMFLLHRADVRPTGDVPAVLTGYGGFSVSRMPSYSAGAVLWAERGGLFALANLRGGGEHGERWHRAGMLESKQRVFDDFHAAAEHLVASGWTSPPRLGATGGSNGGLLVGAALTQRPELFGAIVCAVPLLDMLRYHRLLIARYWIPEYGSAEDAEQYLWLRAYSPYHGVREGARYPAILLTTAEGDSRVDPMHARKMAAALQAHPGADIVLLRVDRDAGHGVGKPLEKQVDDLADQWSFLAARLAAADVDAGRGRESTVES